jgi:hypothetical protein
VTTAEHLGGVFLLARIGVDAGSLAHGSKGLTHEKLTV